MCVVSCRQYPLVLRKRWVNCSGLLCYSHKLEQEYYKTIIPRIIAILRPGSALNRGSHVRAAAYSLSRMLSSNSQFRHQELVATTALPLLQAAFLDPPHCNQPTADKASTTEDAMLSPEDSLVTLIKILTNTDPSPNLISMLLSPILPVLYSLAACISSKKTKDPALQESIDGIIATWGRIVDAAEGIEMVWRVVGGEGGEWEVDVAGRIKRNERHVSRPMLNTPNLILGKTGVIAAFNVHPCQPPGSRSGRGARHRLQCNEPSARSFGIRTLSEVD